MFNLKIKSFTVFDKRIGITSIDTNARKGNAPNWMNWNTFINIKYDYLVTLVVFKNAVVVENT